MKISKFGLVASIVISFLYALCFGGVPGKAMGAPQYGSYSSSSFNFGGFYGQISSSENDHRKIYVDLSVTSRVHEIHQVNTSFSTWSEDSSEGYGSLSISGFKNSDLNTHEHNSSLDLNLGGVSLYQQNQLYAGLDHNNVSFNTGYAFISVLPFNLSSVLLHYDEQVLSTEGEPDVTFFYFSLDFYGSFGPGAEGDRLGAPFVPTPGTAGLVFVSVCMFCRRRR